jgi:chromosome segregation protein
MLKRLEIAGFKSFSKKTILDFSSAATAIVGPNGSGKSNVAEAFRFALGEQSMKSMRGKRSEDLIWSGSHMSPRANRAAVAIVFDNRPRGGTRIFPKVEFDEVTIERAVFRDGSSEYAVNGSRVRLRDIQELLAGANIGETGHHIISQGEADRILLANARERRAMLEDALGLKVFEFKKAEAERKLTKTEENVREVEAMRREIAPHIRFLKKQVERLERAEELANELRAACATYFAIEDLYLKEEHKRVAEALKDAEASLAAARAELAAFDERTTGDQEGARLADTIRRAERDLERLLEQKSGLSRDIGRIEGALEGAKRRSVEDARDPYVRVSREDFGVLIQEVDAQANIPETAGIEAVRAALKGVQTAVAAFFARFASPNDDYLRDEERAVYGYENERNALLAKDAEIATSIEEARKVLLKAREASMAHDETSREERHRVLELAESKAQFESAVARLEGRKNELALLDDELMRDKAEVLALAGSAAVTYEALTALPEEERSIQEGRKKTLERLKIRLEEAGGGNDEVRTEYDEAVAREAFLAKELEDMAKSAAGLRSLIADLDTELQKTFSEGLRKVNASFGEFFALMFGGGSAKLTLEEVQDEPEEGEEEETEGPRVKRPPGIEIAVALPKKRVQSLMQLSGGERALTSIALIFAMSQVNPPPFLILDETDAALDEANSRRYGDMIENLAKKSQLIVITHNRETMSRAGILYGVTMGADGISKLLSVKFEEATAVAK